MTADVSSGSDEADMLALQQGEDLALNRLMTRWQIPLRSFLYRYTHSEHDAMDLAQETFVRIYQHRARYRRGAKFSTWMFQIALNLARDLSRRTKHRANTTPENLPQPTGAVSPDTALVDIEKIAAVREAIAALPTDLREAVLLSEYSGKSHLEIAVIVGASAKAVETRLYRARAALRKTLSRFLQEERSDATS